MHRITTPPRSDLLKHQPRTRVMLRLPGQSVVQLRSVGASPSRYLRTVTDSTKRKWLLTSRQRTLVTGRFIRLPSGVCGVPASNKFQTRNKTREPGNSFAERGRLTIENGVGMLPSIEFIWKVFVSLFAIAFGILALYWVTVSALYLVALAFEAKITWARNCGQKTRADAIVKASIGVLSLIILMAIFWARH